MPAAADVEKPRSPIFFVVLGITLVLCVSGLIMLGVGVSKNNTKNVDCSETATETAPKSLLPKAFFLSLRNPKITVGNLRDDFSLTFKQFSEQAEIGDNVVVSVLSVSESDEKRESPTLGLVGVAFGGESALSRPDLQRLFEQKDFTVIQMETEPPKSTSSQLCLKVQNEEQKIVKRSVDYKAAFPNGAVEFPCSGNVTIAFDTSKVLSATLFARQVDFLSEKVLSDEWDPIERLTLIDYSEKIFSKNFNHISEGRNFVTDSVQTAVQPNLYELLHYIDTHNPERAQQQINVIIFVTKIDRSIVDKSLPLSKTLKQKNIRLSFVGVGSELDSKLLGELVNGDIIEWEVEKRTTPLDWEQKFWSAYGCLEPWRTTVAPPIPYPCSGQIVLAFDSSKSLSKRGYLHEVEFLVTRVFTDEWNNLEGLTLIDYNDKIESQSSFSTINDTRDFISYSTHSAKDPDLQQLFRLLDSRQPLPSHSPINAVLFVSKLDRSIVDKCKPIAKTLLTKNYRLTFVGMGDRLDTSLFWELSARDLIEWNIDADEEPRNWEEKFFKAYGCEIVTTTPPPRPTRPPPPYGHYPCLGNIIVAFDSSKSIRPQFFESEKSFLTEKVFNRFWTQLNRLALIEYNEFANTQPYSTFETVFDAVDFIRDKLRSNSRRPNLKRLFQSIDINDLASPHAPSHAIIFISEVTRVGVDEAKRYVKDIERKRCTITFVAVGRSVDITLLRELSNNIIQWDPFLTETPRNWEQTFWNAYGCRGYPPKFPPVPDPEDRYPCRRNFLVAYDTSGSNTKAAFNVGFPQKVEILQTEINFVRDEVFNRQWNHLEQLLIADYSAKTYIGEFNENEKVEDVHIFINESLWNQDQDPSLRKLLLEIDKRFTFPLPVQLRAVVFVSKMNKYIVAENLSLITKLRQKNCEFTFVTLNTDVDIPELRRLSLNIIQWDANEEAEPRGWRTHFWKAYGCGLFSNLIANSNLGGSPRLF